MRRARGLLAPLVACLALLALLTWAARRLDVVEVRGNSMAPTLLPGDRLLVARATRPPRVGQIVLAPDPREPSRELVKRVVAAGERGVTLRGDNARASTDSGAFGVVGADLVQWRVVARYWPLVGVGRRARRRGRDGD